MNVTRKRNGTSAAALAVVALLALSGALAAGCQEEAAGGPGCGDGTRLEAGVCVPVCGPGAERDAETGTCVPTCLAGTHRDEATGQCLPDSGACTTGQVWVVEEAACVDVASVCAEGSTWVAGEGACVPDETRPVADQVEGSDENDPRFGDPTAVELLTLPAVGERLTFSGSLDPLVDRDDDGWLDADFDFWLFEADGPTWLRVRAEGLGGATSGFLVFGFPPHEQWYRLAIGTTGADATKDVFLPAAGVYCFYMSDGLNYLSQGAGPWHGGGALGYFVEVERRALPEPIPLTLEDGVLDWTDFWPATPPEDAPGFHLYSLRVAPRSVHLFDIDRGKVSGEAEGELWVIGERDTFLVGTRGQLHGFLEEEELLLVVDTTFNFAPYEIDYAIQARELPSLWTEEPVLTEVAQPDWAPPLGLPTAYFGFGGTLGDIVTIRAASSTGRTCWEFYNEAFDHIFSRVNCDAAFGLPRVDEVELRLLAPYDGYYPVAAIDWDGAAIHPQLGVTSIPGHSYVADVDVRRQFPLVAGDARTPFERSGEPLDEAQPERFVVAKPDPGGALRVTAVSSGWPVVTPYQPYGGMLAEVHPGMGPDLVWRSFDGASGLFGVRDMTGAAAFDLRIERHELSVAGTVSTDAPLEATVPLVSGQSATIAAVRTAEPGLVTLSLSAETPLLVTLLDPELTPRGAGFPVGPDAPVELTVGANADGVYLEVRADQMGIFSGAPALDIAATLAPATAEVDRGESVDDTQALTLPAVVSGTFRNELDLDGYRVTLAEPARLVVTTLPPGVGPALDTMVGIAGADGAYLVTDDDGGAGLHARAVLEVTEPGTYLVGVSNVAMETTDYVLVVTTEPL